MRVKFENEGKHTTIVTVEGLPQVTGCLYNNIDRYAQSGGAFIMMSHEDEYHYSTPPHYEKGQVTIPVTTKKLTQKEVRGRLLTMFKALNKELKAKL